jgi:hypothetical protein
LVKIRTILMASQPSANNALNTSEQPAPDPSSGQPTPGDNSTNNNNNVENGVTESSDPPGSGAVDQSTTLLSAALGLGNSSEGQNCLDCLYKD